MIRTNGRPTLRDLPPAILDITDGPWCSYGYEGDGYDRHDRCAFGGDGSGHGWFIGNDTGDGRSMSAYMTGTKYRREGIRVLAEAMHPGDGHGIIALFGDGHGGSPGGEDGDGLSIDDDPD